MFVIGPLFFPRSNRVEQCEADDVCPPDHSRQLKLGVGSLLLSRSVKHTMTKAGGVWGGTWGEGTLGEGLCVRARAGQGGEGRVARGHT